MASVEHEREGYPPSLQPVPFGVLPEQLPSCGPASAAFSREQIPSSVKHRVHHSYIWLGGIKVSIVILISMFASMSSAFMDAATDLADIRDTAGLLLVVAVFCIVLIGIAGIILLIRWWSYRHLYYEIGAGEFNVHSGIFNKKHTHIPYQRIQSVNQKATLVQRILGVCSVSIDTAGGAANKVVTVPYVQKAQAEELRRELFARKNYALAMQAYAESANSAKEDGPSPCEGDPYAVAGNVIQPHQIDSALPFPPSLHMPASFPGNAFPAGFNVAGSNPAGSNPAGSNPAGFNTFAANNAVSNVLDVPAGIWDSIKGVFAGEGVDTGTVTYEYGLSNKELIFTGLSNNTAYTMIVLGIVGALSQVAMPLFMMFDPVMKVGLHLFNGGVLAVAVLGLVAIGLFIWVMSALGVCLSYGGFRAVRRGSRIEVERGLLQHQFQSVDVDRVQSVVVRQSFIRRLIGYCELSVSRIDAVQKDSNEKQNAVQPGMVIHPFVKLNRVPEILAGVLPEFAGVPQETKPVAPVALRRALIRRCILQGWGFWLAVLIAVMHSAFAFFTYPGVTVSVTTANSVNAAAILGYVCCVVLFILDAIGARLWFRESSFACNEYFMQISNGGFTRETMNFPRNKIQFGYTKTNPFQRLAHTATIQVRTAAGVGGTTLRLIDVSVDDAQEWLEWMKPRRSVIQ